MIPPVARASAVHPGAGASVAESPTKPPALRPLRGRAVARFLRGYHPSQARGFNPRLPIFDPVRGHNRHDLSRAVPPALSLPRCPSRAFLPRFPAALSSRAFLPRFPPALFLPRFPAALSLSCCPSHAVPLMLSLSCCPSHAVPLMLFLSCYPAHAVPLMLSLSCCPSWGAGGSPGSAPPARNPFWIAAGEKGGLIAAASVEGDRRTPENNAGSKSEPGGFTNP